MPFGARPAAASRVRIRFRAHLGQPLRWWVLLDDAEFAALALWALHAAYRTPTGVEPSTPSSMAVRGTPEGAVPGDST